MKKSLIALAVLAAAGIASAQTTVAQTLPSQYQLDRFAPSQSYKAGNYTFTTDERPTAIVTADRDGFVVGMKNAPEPAKNVTVFEVNGVTMIRLGGAPAQ